MKRILAAVMSIMVFSAGSAFGWLTTQGDGTVSDFPVTNVGANVTFAPKVSANVTVGYEADSTAAPNGGTYYALSTYHSSGSKTYGTTSSESRIFMAEQGTTKTAITWANAQAGWTGWTAVK